MLDDNEGGLVLAQALLEVPVEPDGSSASIVLEPGALIEAAGTAELGVVNGVYAVQAEGADAGMLVRAFGGTVAQGQLGAWVAIGAEQTAGGFEIAWKAADTDLYTVWTLDSGGTLSSMGPFASGHQWAVQSAELDLRQDLNGDGLVGPTSHLIEGWGSTQLIQVSDVYLLSSPGGAVAMKAFGGLVAEGQLGAWTPIGAEQTAGGYQVAWKVSNGDLYTVWTLDGSGDLVSIGSYASGHQWALQSAEPGLRQDLNGDGVVGAYSYVIEGWGATQLVHAADRYFLVPQGTGPSFQIDAFGGPLTEGSLGAWSPIGAEWTSTGYELAWKAAGSDLFTIWALDLAGDLVSVGSFVGGHSSSLLSAETRFQQDLNGDGAIGDSGFNITISYSGNATYQSYFTAAAQRWERVITADIPDVVSATWGYIDDLLISATVTSIDGPGGLLGQAGPNEVRAGSLLPSHGVMRFDSADLATMASAGILTDVITHEMGHVLGIGSLWSALGLKSGYNYIGSGGVEAYRILGGNAAATSVPLETGGGSGTAGVHWSDSVFGNEIMTGYIGSAPNPLSILTVAALQDLGYAVNYAAADSYTMPGHSGSGAVTITAITGGGTTPIISGGSPGTFIGRLWAFDGSGVGDPVAETVPFSRLDDDDSLPWAPGYRVRVAKV